MWVLDDPPVVDIFKLVASDLLLVTTSPLVVVADGVERVV